MNTAYDAYEPILAGASVERRLGVYLWRSSFLEQAAAGGFEKFARWDFLGAEDHAVARHFAEQEREHAAALRGLGQAFICERPDAHLHALYVPEEPWTLLAGVHQAERMLFAGFARMADLGRTLGVPELTAAYERIAEEERGHIAWGRLVLRRILADPRYAPEARAYLNGAPIAREFRAVRAEMPWR